MSDAFDELERQLRRAVRAADNVRPLRPRRGWRRTSAVALAAALAVSGGALAATQLGGGRSAETQGRKIVFQAVRETAMLPACTLVIPMSRPVLSDSAPLPEITAALPSLASPAPDDDQARALSMLPRGGGTGGAVLRGTARTITVPGGVTLLVYVQQGAGIGAVRDPDACGQARRERAEALDKNRSEDVKRWAERRLAQLRDTAPGLQTLWVSAKMTGRSATGGSGMPVRPGQPLHPALVFSGSVGRRRSVYVGIAGPRASRVLVRAQRGARIPGAPARVPVRQGFYAVVLPAGTGPVRLNEVTANGTRLRVVRLRG
jgi:hypothetical protein